MSTIRIDDRATPALKKLAAHLPDNALQHVIGRTASNLTRRHLITIAATRHRSYVPHNFFAAQRNQVNYQVDNDKTYLVIGAPLALRYYGGTIKPRNAKALTIPARREAEGRRAREFSNTFVGRTKKGKGFIAQQDGKAIRILYWLVKSTTHKPDPSVLPTPNEFATEITKQTEAAIARR